MRNKKVQRKASDLECGPASGWGGEVRKGYRIQLGSNLKMFCSRPQGKKPQRERTKYCEVLDG